MVDATEQGTFKMVNLAILVLKVVFVLLAIFEDDRGLVLR